SETVQAQRPIRRWLRGFVVLSLLMTLLSLVLFVRGLLPYRDFRLVADSLEKITERDFAAANENLKTINEKRHRLNKEVVRSIDASLLLVRSEVQKQLDVIQDELNNGNFDRAKFYLDQATAAQWPDEDLQRFQNLRDQFDRTIAATIDEKV